ncbi:hypothetical protein INS49_003024 [Diaporthe citri]|uniref:uncharacterized protein n=1 Tax=Diaporthe citri TaxID=83186 RepID=UPI001C7E1E52|nr:uncharacterized protein INS49_003024 [Diaporthe citri]KAG6368808.1 hypothetical protein INS49_003024 [Diaporthe citri]
MLCCFVLLVLLIRLWSKNGGHPLVNTTISDWISLPSPAEVKPSDRVPRLNTSWHEQIELEMTMEKANLSRGDNTWPLPYLVPLLVHFMSVVPPEWSFRFMGSAESLAMMQSNPTIRRYITRKKLFIDLIPYDVVKDINSYGTVNRLLTTPWLYEEWLWPAEWLFLFQDDSMICSASSMTLNDFVDEDWPTAPNGVNGGFSLRKVPHLIQMLHTRSFEDFVADGNPAAEDHYFSTSMWKLPGTKVPVGTEAIRFGVVIQYSPNDTEMPLGFHPFSSHGLFRGAEGQANQDKAYKYCPELGIIALGRWDSAAAKMAVPCAWARGMNLYGIAAIPWFPSEVLKLATSDVQQPLKKSPVDTNTIAMKPADDLLTSSQALRHDAGNLSDDTVALCQDRPLE